MRRLGSALLVSACMVFLLASPRVRAQSGDGPRMYDLAPKDLNALLSFFMMESGNTVPNQNVVAPTVDIDTSVYTVMYGRTFALGNAFAEAFGTLTGGSVDASVFPTPIRRGSSGLADSYLGLVVGLSEMPALGVEDWAKHKPGTMISGLFTLSLPSGDYRSGQPINLGSNRWSFRFGLPIVATFASPSLLPGNLNGMDGHLTRVRFVTSF